MKTNGHKPAQLQGGNLMSIETILGKAKLERTPFGLYLLVADLLDEIQAGNPLSMYIGATKNRSAFAVYINGTDEFPGLFGTNLEELAAVAVDFL